jgi:surfeit locus 1 family protein
VEQGCAQAEENQDENQEDDVSHNVLPVHEVFILPPLSAGAASMLSRSEGWAALCLAALTTLFVAAGFWQVGRAQYKTEIQQTLATTAAAAPIQAGAGLLDGAAAHLRRLEAHGVWLPERTILLDNKVRQGVVGYEVVTPLKLDDSSLYLLVNRGWIKAPVLRSELPQIVTPTGPLVLEGVARIPSTRFIELGADVVSGQVWQNLTIERYAQWSQLPLQPVLLYQEGDSDDGLLRVEAAPEAAGMNAERHRGYALTWFSLAAVTVILGLLGWRRSRRSKARKLHQS